MKQEESGISSDVKVLPKQIYRGICFALFAKIFIIHFPDCVSIQWVSVPLGWWSSEWCHNVWKRCYGSLYHPGHAPLYQCDKSTTEEKNQTSWFDLIPHSNITVMLTHTYLKMHWLDPPSCWALCGGCTLSDQRGQWCSPHVQDARPRYMPPYGDPCESSWGAS